MELEDGDSADRGSGIASREEHIPLLVDAGEFAHFYGSYWTAL